MKDSERLVTLTCGHQVPDGQRVAGSSNLFICIVCSEQADEQVVRKARWSEDDSDTTE